MKKTAYSLVFPVLIVTFASPPARMKFDMDFEEMTPGNFPKSAVGKYNLMDQTHPGRGINSTTIVTSPVRSGKRACRFAATVRNEFQYQWSPPKKTDIWYGWSIYIEKLSQWAYFGQIHTIPDGDCKREAHRNPTPGFITIPPPEGPAWKVEIMYSHNHCNPTEREPDLFYWKSDPWKIPVGQWMDIIIHIYYDYGKSNNSGRTQVWYKTGPGKTWEKKVDYKGPNVPDDNNLPRLKFGVHKGSPNIAVWDNIKIYQGGGSTVGSEGWNKVNPDPGAGGVTAILPIQPRNRAGNRGFSRTAGFAGPGYRPGNTVAVTVLGETLRAAGMNVIRGGVAGTRRRTAGVYMIKRIEDPGTSPVTFKEGG